MDTRLEQPKKKQALRHYVLVMAFAVVGGLLIAYGSPVFLYLSQDRTIESTVNDTPAVSEFERSAPVSLKIPALSIDTTFVPPLGLNPDRTVSVPDSYTKVGWYEGGATPGEVGPSVILGHVDSYEGPAIFFSLGQLKPGDEVEIAREDGSVALFIVTKLERYSQDAFPTELVYGKTDIPTLRLVTCSGTFNKGVQRYSHNLVVYAELKK